MSTDGSFSDDGDSLNSADGGGTAESSDAAVDVRQLHEQVKSLQATVAQLTRAGGAASVQHPAKTTESEALKVKKQTEMLAGLPDRLHPKTFPCYYLPWLGAYVRRLSDGELPVGLPAAGQRGPDGETGEHVDVVSQWSTMFEAALKKHLSEDRFDNVNVQMCEAVVCIAQRNFFRDPLFIAETFRGVIVGSGNGRYVKRLSDLGFVDDYQQINMLDIVAATCHFDAKAAGAVKSTVDAHLQRKIQTYLQCRQWKTQRLRQRLRTSEADDDDDYDSGGGSSAASSAASSQGKKKKSSLATTATGVAIVEVKLCAPDYVDAKLEALRKIGDARALIEKGLVLGIVVETANSASPAFRDALIEDSANHPTIAKVLGPGVELTAANCREVIASASTYLRQAADEFVERHGDETDDIPEKTVVHDPSNPFSWRRKRKSQWGRYHQQIDDDGEEIAHGNICRLRRCRFYGIGEHSYKSKECLYWCQSETCVRSEPHRFVYAYCILGEYWDPLL